MNRITKNTDKIQWYIVRKKGEKRWAAYELTTSQRKTLQPHYEAKGPYKSLVVCMMKANSQTTETLDNDCLSL